MGYVSEPSGHLPAFCSSGSKTNILIDNDGHARLTGFSRFTIVSEQSTVAPSPTASGTIRWMSPELFDPVRFGLEESRPTKESDCYALGMVIYEVLSGQIPYALYSQLVVIQKILDGERPRRPQGIPGARFTNGLWGVLELCWEARPDDRTSLNVVLQCLQDVARPQELHSGAGGPMSLMTVVNDSRTFSPCHPRLPFHYSWGTGLQIAHGNNGLPVLPRPSGSREGRIRDRLMRGVRKISGVIT